MITATIQKAEVTFTDFPYVYWDVTVSNYGTEIVRKAFGIDAEKSRMLDWATNAGAEEVTFKL